MSATVTRAAMTEDWDLLLSFFPENWQELAARTGALRELRTDKSLERPLRTLLIHRGCGHSLRETVVRARKAHLAVPKWYRLCRQVELVFKRFKSLTQLGHLPKYDEESARAWLNGKLVVVLLVEKVMRHARTISPWGYDLAAAATPKSMA